jgi:hypothetical protein
MATGDMETYNGGNDLSEQNELKLRLVNEQKMCLESFMLKVKDELTVSCSIPVKIPDSNLLSIIGRSKEWFYKHYEYSVEEGFLYIDRALYETDQFKIDRSIVLPKDIYSVYGVHKINHKYFDIGKEFIRYSNTYVNYGVESTFEDLMGYVAAEKYNSLRSDILTKKWTSFNFNNLTHKFRLSGEVVDTDLVLEVYRIVPDCELFQDELFFRYVVAQAQKNIALVLGMFAYNLPGNITINYDLIQSLGQEEITKIEEQVKSEEGTDWFMIGN